MISMEDLLLIERTLAWSLMLGVAITAALATWGGDVAAYADRWTGAAIALLAAGWFLHQLYFWVGALSALRGRCYEVGWVDPLCNLARHIFTGNSGVAHLAYAMVIAGCLAVVVRPFLVAFWWSR